MRYFLFYLFLNIQAYLQFKRILKSDNNPDFKSIKKYPINYEKYRVKYGA